MKLFLILTAIAAVSLFFQNMRWILFFYVPIVVLNYIYPRVRFLIIKIYYYKKIKMACLINQYAMKSTLKSFIFPEKDSNKPDMSIKIDNRIYAIKVLGYYRRPAKYVFLSNNSYSVHKINVLLSRRAILGGMEDHKKIPVATFEFTENMQYKSLPDMDTEAVMNIFGNINNECEVVPIILFCPKFVICQKVTESKTEPLYDGNEVYNYQVYNVKEFMRQILKK